MSAYSTRTRDWRIDIVTSGQIGAGLSAHFTLWRFWSPRLNYCCATFSTGVGLGVSIGANLDINGQSIGAALAAASGGAMNEHLVIINPFAAKQLRDATMNEFSVGVAGLFVDISGNTFLVKDSGERELFAFKGGGIGATLGLELNIGRFKHSRFNPPIVVPPSRWEVLQYQRAQREG